MTHLEWDLVVAAATVFAGLLTVGLLVYTGLKFRPAIANHPASGFAKSGLVASILSWFTGPGALLGAVVCGSLALGGLVKGATGSDRIALTLATVHSVWILIVFAVLLLLMLQAIHAR